LVLARRGQPRTVLAAAPAAPRCTPRACCRPVILPSDVAGNVILGPARFWARALCAALCLRERRVSYVACRGRPACTGSGRAGGPKCARACGFDDACFGAAEL